MKNAVSVIKVSIVLFAVLLFSAGCKSNVTGPEDSQLTDKDAMLKLVDGDETISSFESNFDEEEALDMVYSKTGAEIFPVKMGQKMLLTSRDLQVNVVGDTAYGTLTKTFEGVLYIAASLDSIDTQSKAASVDTVIEKTFNTTVVRNIIFAKRDNAVEDDSVNLYRNWKIQSVSLVKGGTALTNAEITKITFTMPDAEYTVENPLEYYLDKGPGWRRHICSIGMSKEVLVKIEVTSSYAEDEYVSLTYGAAKNGLKWRTKRFLELTSSVQNGNIYTKIYEGTFNIRQFVGHKHAVVNVVPFSVANDDSAPVEESTWGFPYFVK